MKTCYRCDETKSLTEFHKNKARADGHQNYCKGCAKIRNRAYYISTPERNPQRQVSKNTAVARGQKFVWEYLMTHPCVDCGESDPIVLEFDHVIGEKSLNISDAVRRGSSINRIMEEIAKCHVRCANCHRRITAARGGWYKAFTGNEGSIPSISTQYQCDDTGSTRTTG